MTIGQRKEKFISLGRFLGQFGPKESKKEEKIPFNDPFFERLEDQIQASVHHNGWFTRENVVFALQQWSKALTAANLDKWLAPYNLRETSPRTVGIIMAGNIPMVGFHDFLSVLISGNKVKAKQSSNDKLLLPVIADYLIALAPEWKDFIHILPGKDQGGRLENYDAVIATGSNNTARYFEYYFADKPSIIRKNRNSVAVLTGSETKEELGLLGEDIFRYYGLGCRNVSKLYVPEGYSFENFFRAIYPWNPIINQAKYANNYDYNKAVYLMSLFKLQENGFLILKEDASFGSPIATLFYQTYSDLSDLKAELESHKDSIQCVVTRNVHENEIPFGKTQQPELWDYADNVDTMDFLLELSN